MDAGLDYKTGETTQYNYINNTLTNSTITYNNTTKNDNITRFVGVWLAMTGAIGIAITTAEISRGVI